MTNRELWIMGLAFGIGYKLKEYFFRKEVTEMNETWDKLVQDVALQTGATTAILSFLEDGEVDEAIEFWNEHVDFMKAIENY